MNAFMSHYFHSSSIAVAAALRMQLDLGPKLARASRTRAEAAESEYRRSEALSGILLEVRKAYDELVEVSVVSAVERASKRRPAPRMVDKVAGHESPRWQTPVYWLPFSCTD